MTRQEATETLCALVRVEVEGTKQENTRQGGMTKKLRKEELSIIRRLFGALTGYVPTNEEVDSIIGMI